MNNPILLCIFFLACLASCAPEEQESKPNAPYEPYNVQELRAEREVLEQVMFRQAYADALIYKFRLGERRPLIDLKVNLANYDILHFIKDDLISMGRRRIEAYHLEKLCEKHPQFCFLRDSAARNRLPARAIGKLIEQSPAGFKKESELETYKAKLKKHNRWLEHYPSVFSRVYFNKDLTRGVFYDNNGSGIALCIVHKTATGWKLLDSILLALI